MDYPLHDQFLHATSWQSRQAAFVRMSFLLAGDRREPSDGLVPGRQENQADCLLRDAAATPFLAASGGETDSTMPDHEDQARDPGTGLVAGQLRLRSGPQTALLPPGMGLQIAPILRTRFLLHERDVLLEGQSRTSMQPLDRQLLDAEAPCQMSKCWLAACTTQATR